LVVRIQALGLAGVAAALMVALAMPVWSQSGARVQSYSFAFQGADVAQVVEEVVGRGLGLSYTIDPAVTA
jgi:general secretion pathway protein D